VAAVAGAVQGSLVPDPVSFTAGQVAVVALAAAGCLAVLLPSRPNSVGDATGEPLLGTRLRAARIVTAAAVVTAAAWAGGPGVAALAPAGAALLGVVVPRPRRGDPVT